MFILRVNCKDRPGIVAAVSACLSDANCNIEESGQFNDHLSGQFFMRVVYSPLAEGAQDLFCQNFERVAHDFQMVWRVSDEKTRVKTIIMVSKEDHCLHEILYRRSCGNLLIDVAAVVSNHEICRAQVEAQGIPFHYLPVTTENKNAQEQVLRDIIDETGTELIVLARYMQILSEAFCRDFRERVINIHHSFLPGFKGARPYHQAYERGVKLIGATAHFVTGDLDEGPIIEQETMRISHADDPERLQVKGRDTEKRVLANALELYAQRRVFLQNNRTVIL